MRLLILLAFSATAPAQTDDNVEEIISRGYFSHATTWDTCTPMPPINETCIASNNISTTGCRRNNHLCEGTNQSYAIILFTEYGQDGCHYNIWIWSCAMHWLTCENGTSCACNDANNASTCVCTNITNPHHCLPEDLDATSTPTTSATSTPTTSATSTPTTSATSTPTTSATSATLTTSTPTTSATSTLASTFTSTPAMTTLFTTMCPTGSTETSGSTQDSKSTDVVEKTPWWIPVVCIMTGALVGALIAVVAQRKMVPRAPLPNGRKSFYNPVYSGVGPADTV